MKKTIAILLVLAMVLSMIPLIGASAETTWVDIYVDTSANYVQWSNANLYYWGGSEGNAWPGTALTKVSDYLFHGQAPINSNIIVNNGNNQTGNIEGKLTAAGTYLVKVSESWGNYSGNVFGLNPDGTSPITVHVKENTSWNAHYVYSWGYGSSGSSSPNGSWPGSQLTGSSDGWFTTTISGSASFLIIHNNSGSQTPDLNIGGLGTEIWVDPANNSVSNTAPDSNAPSDPVYVIAGAEGLTGENWNPASSNHMVKNLDGTYSVTYPNVAVGDYSFKVTNGTDWNAANHWEFPTEGDKKLTVSTAGSVTITFNPDAQEFTLSGADWYVAPAVLDVNSVCIAGNGHQIADNAWLGGAEWNVTASANMMTETSEGIWEITFTDVPATVSGGSWYNFKFALNGSWDHSFGTGAVTSGQEAAATYNGGDLYFSLSEISDIAIKLDLTGYNHANNTGAKYTVTITPVVYTFTVTPEGGTEGAKTAFDGNSATLDNQAVGSYTVKLYRNDVLADTKTVEVESANSSIVISHAASVLSASAQAHTYSVSDGTSTKDLVLGADNKYSFTFEGVAAGTYTYTVKEDGTVTIGSVNVTVDEDDSKVTIVYTPNSATPVTSSVKAPDPVHYYVAGTENLCGNAWSQNDANNELTKGSNGKYSKTYTGLQPGKKYEFKITNGAWPPSGQEWSDNGSNYEFAVSEASDVTIVFDPATGSVDILGDKVTEYQPPVDIDYYVVGIGSIFGDKTWADAATVAGNKMEKQADGSYKKVYTVTTAGTIELKVHSPADNGWYGDGSNNFVINATEGMTITVTFANGAASVETAGGTQGGGTTPPPATEDTYHLVGSGSVFSAEWSTDGGFPLTKGSDGKYTKVFENVAAGELGFKVVKNNTVWIPDGMGNETKVTAKQGATVTVVFDPADNSITATAVGGTDSDDDDDDQGGGTVTPPASTYYVAGNADLTGASWDENDPNNLMTAAGSKFSKTYTGLQPGKKYEFKITDGTWTNSWGIGDNKSDNYVFAVSAESSVTITFDPATKEITVTGDKLTAYVPEVTSATVVGSKGLCGGAADWASENDGAMVKGTDGKFVKVFSNVAAGNYECKVLTNNGDWYPGSNVSVAVSANGSTVTVTFDPAAGTVTASVKAPEGGDQGDDDDDQGGTVTPPPATNDVYHVVGSGSIFAADWTIADADKMEKQSDGTYKKVYTGVAKGNLGIKVVKNNTTWIPDGFDNEIKAEVTADNSTVTVTYNPTTGKVDVKINGKAAGSATGTPEGGNTGDSGTTVKEITIYAKVPSHWTAPKAWAWKGSQNVATTGWPGELNMVKGENGWWSIKITSNIEGVLICNVVGTAVEQTADVKVTTAGANIYVTVGEKQADGKYAATATFESVPSNGDETNLFGMVVVTMAAVLGMGITVLSKKKFF